MLGLSCKDEACSKSQHLISGPSQDNFEAGDVYNDAAVHALLPFGRAPALPASVHCSERHRGDRGSVELCQSPYA